MLSRLCSIQYAINILTRIADEENKIMIDFSFLKTLMVGNACAIQQFMFCIHTVFTHYKNLPMQ